MESCERGSLAPAKAEAEENESGGWRRMSWDMRLSARASFVGNSRKQNSEGPKAAPSKEKHVSWRMDQRAGAPAE